MNTEQRARKWLQENGPSPSKEQVRSLASLLDQVRTEERETAMRIEVPYKEMSYDQVTYNPKLDRKCGLDEGLYVMHHDGWELVTSYPSRNYAETTMFVFRRRA